MTNETIVTSESRLLKPKLQFQLHLLKKMLNEILGDEKYKLLDSEERNEALRVLTNSNFYTDISNAINKAENIKQKEEIEKVFTGNVDDYVKDQYEEVLKSEVFSKIYNDAFELLKKSLLIHH